MKLIVTVNNIAGFEHEVAAWGKTHRRAPEIRAAVRAGLSDLRASEVKTARKQKREPDWEFIGELNNAIDGLNRIAAWQVPPVAGSVDSAANRGGE